MKHINTNHNKKSLMLELINIVNKDDIIEDSNELDFYSSDIFYESSIKAFLAVTPKSPAEVASVIKLITSFDIPVIPRGGGMSYTAGYTPSVEGSVIVDLRKLDKIIEINKKDMFVTVECGVTWKKLYEELKSNGLRTPYFGPFSGMHATVGGALSQNSVFYGSSLYGTAADSVLSLDVALQDGKILKTGSNSNKLDPSPFFRTYGPDLTGLFLGDTGALGFKVRATLRLISYPEEQRFASFNFSNENEMFEAMGEITRQQLAHECYGFDPFLMSLRMKFEGLKKDLKTLGDLSKSQKNVFSGVKEIIKVASTGRSFMEGVDFAMHITVEGRDNSDVESSLKRIKNIADLNNGKEIANSLPKLVRANPFLPLNRLLGPKGERWVPIHVILPHSKIKKTLKNIKKYFDTNREIIEKNKIQYGYLTSTIGTSAVLLEPTFFWEDSHYEIHKRYIEDDHYKKLKIFPENLDARNAMVKIREDMSEIFMNNGGTHLQIGKMYRYKENREEVAWNLLLSIKKALDPNNLVNPGSLGIK
ncbi:MAG: putative FAD-linked oxidoreductase [Alphaproteobacteria bacterium MarineAlpha2_Bin1]|nr:MAG: putative FAD-linked oxidoreductase [Alphaproteobacteria bacterium MarineAlpha2_Bin1]